ncbi:GNAT family N-acetyltransferase [Sporomusa sp.]|uniref:GNAT family N-acetyltransferase n=1 Tax=Sporomusa sp. TaxID=2078658 RepID=UPI002CEFEACC|nr:GNAT family N-acetyltransferase [Sporomusa sp.]HWR41615.1 GNAT family N-acetyltransferase [Sporomusa sp.]
MSDYAIGEVTFDELSKVTSMVKAVFDKFIAPSFLEEGIRSVYDLIASETIKNRLLKNSFMLVARKEDQIIGVIEFYYINHMLLLFTAETWHGCGIARSLLEAGISRCCREHEGLNQITVGAFELAIPFYEKMGFVIYDQEQTINGIRFTPMLKAF